MTDKERLEEIKENAMRNRAHYKTVGTNESYWGYSYELSDKDYTWLIEQAELAQKLARFKEYFDELYGEGLEIAYWHKNDDLELFDNLYDAAIENMEDEEE